MVQHESGKLNAHTYWTTHTLHAGRYIPQVVRDDVVAQDSLVVDHECTGSTVYQLYTGRVHHRTRATCDRGCTADRSH